MLGKSGDGGTIGVDWRGKCDDVCEGPESILTSAGGGGRPVAVARGFCEPSCAEGDAGEFAFSIKPSRILLMPRVSSSSLGDRN